MMDSQKSLPGEDLGVSDPIQFASFVGTLPGPTTGMTLSTQQVVDHLEGHCDLRKFDLGRWFTQHGNGWRLQKMIFSIVAAFQVLIWKRRPNEGIYFALNSTTGLIYNVIQILAARARGFRCVLHHHVYNYIETPNWRMKLLLKVARKDSVHVMACQQMVLDFNKIYQSEIHAFVIPPMIVEMAESHQAQSDGLRTIGHLSNLTQAKGLLEVLRTFDELAHDNPDVQLILAGPCHRAEDRRQIERSIAKHGDRVKFLGPVYEADKKKFFDQIDLFIFPTRAESWGIVLNEALAASVPVISSQIACIPCLVAEGGYLIAGNDDFVKRSAEKTRQWLANPDDFLAIREVAANRGRELKEDTMSKMKQLVQIIVAGK